MIVNNLLNSLKRAYKNLFLKLKDRVAAKELSVHARHCEYSMLLSTDDDNAQPSKYLISLALKAIQNAQEVSLADISARLKKPPYYTEIWPGEHYKLLAGLVIELKPKLIIEIGTGDGLSALSMKKYFTQSPESKIVTFDLIKWRLFPNSCLREDDFKDGKLVQYIDNIAEDSTARRHALLLKEADMIFVDGPKDGVTEQKIWDNFKAISFNKKPLIVFDDIRIWNMLKFWRDISFPKLDLTSFGHWLGTGLVEWRP